MGALALLAISRHIAQMLSDSGRTFWKGLTLKEQTAPTAYQAALQTYIDAKHEQLHPPMPTSIWHRRTPAPFTEEFVDDLEWRLTLPYGNKPARVL